MKGRLLASVCAIGMLAAAPAFAVGTGMSGTTGTGMSGGTQTMQHEKPGMSGHAGMNGQAGANAQSGGTAMNGDTGMNGTPGMNGNRNGTGENNSANAMGGAGAGGGAMNGGTEQATGNGAGMGGMGHQGSENGGMGQNESGPRAPSRQYAPSHAMRSPSHEMRSMRRRTAENGTNAQNGAVDRLNQESLEAARQNRSFHPGSGGMESDNGGMNGGAQQR